MRRAGLDPDPWQRAVLASRVAQRMLLCSRQVGKTAVASAVALNTALLEPPALVLVLSPSGRQSGEFVRAVKRLYAALDRSQPPCRPRTVQERAQEESSRDEWWVKLPAKEQESALQLHLENGSRVIGLPASDGTIRGYSGVTLLVIDEAARVLDGLYRSVRPMLAASGGRLLALSTPFGRRGWFFDEWHGEGEWERTRVKAEECPRIPKAFLEEERRSLGPEWFAQEYECDFLSGGLALYPAEWLSRAESLANDLRGRRRVAKALGVDPGEGRANTAWAVVDEWGLIDLIAVKTPDTSVIRGQTVALMNQYRIKAEDVVFDRGGGGRQIADAMRASGLMVRTIAFGEGVSPDPKRGMRSMAEQRDIREDRYAYRNMRSAMYWQLRELLDPSREGAGFAIPAEHVALRRQLAAFPLRYDNEGRLELPPKSKRGPDDTRETLVDIIGCSPDESDALVLGCWAMLHKPKRVVAGAF